MRLAVLCLAAVPPIAALLLILYYGVDAPFLDDFLTPARLLEKRATGTAEFTDWIAQHNEHRMLLPRLIFVGLASFGGWVPRMQMFASWAAAALTLWNLIQLIPASVKARTLVPVLATSVLVFSTIQYQNWTFAIQLVMFLPLACLTSALVVLDRGSWSWRTRLLCCAALASVATFSAGSGMLCWLALIPALAAAVPRERWRSVFALWLAGFALSVVIYFYGYVQPRTASLWHAVRHPVDAAYWFLAFLGSPIGWANGPAAAVAAGAALVWTGVLSWRTRGKAALPWITLLIYTLGVAASATLARSGDGMGQALSARYSTAALPLLMVQVNLAFLVPGGRLVASLVLALHLLACWRSFSWMEEFWRERRYGRACMVWSAAVQTACLKQIYPDHPRLGEQVNRLDGLGHIPFARAKDPALPRPTAIPSTLPGNFDGLTRLPDGNLRASGWSGRHDRYRGPDLVLIAYENDEGKPVIFALSEQPMRFRDDVTQFAKHPRIGWHADFTPSALPRRRVMIRAYAFRVLRDGRENPNLAWEIVEIPGGPADLDNR